MYFTVKKSASCKKVKTVFKVLQNGQGEIAICRQENWQNRAFSGITEAIQNRILGGLNTSPGKEGP